MEVVSYFIYGASFWFREVAGGIECVFFKEEPDFVAAAEEVVVSYMIAFFSCRELCHGMIGE